MPIRTSPLDVFEAARNRVSIRKYTDEPVSDQEILELVDVAGRAPSPWNIQPWRVIAVRDPELKARLQEAAMNQTQVGAAPVVLVVTADMETALAELEHSVSVHMPEERRRQEIETIRSFFSTWDVSARAAYARQITYIFLGYLLLAAEAVGYGTSPMLGFDPARVKELLGLADHVEIPALVSLGHKGEEGFPQYRRPARDLLVFRG